jgi:hypothetical protein
MLARLTLVQKVGDDLAAVQQELSCVRHLCARTDVLAPCDPYRSFQHAVLSLEQFVQIFNVSWSFVLACEVVAGRMIVSLRGVTASQVSGGPDVEN